MLCVLTNACEIKECEALELKRTLAGIELMLNVPIITSGAPTTVLGATWFTLPVLYGASGYYSASEVSVDSASEGNG